jgi:hypothetical protein
MNGIQTFNIVASTAAFEQVRILTGLQVEIEGEQSLVQGFKVDGFGGAKGAKRTGKTLFTSTPEYSDGAEGPVLDNPEAISDQRMWTLAADERHNQRDTPEQLTAFMSAVTEWMTDPENAGETQFDAITAVLDNPQAPTVRRAALLPYLWQTGAVETLDRWNSDGVQVVGNVRTLLGVSLVSNRE